MDVIAERLDAAARWIDAHPALSFTALTLLYGIAAGILSSIRLLWFDELITLHLARLNSLPAIWHMLARGADPNPPLMPFAVMLCRNLFGEHELALRLPSIAGYWLGILSLFLFLLRRIPAAWALGGATLLIAVAASQYSYESRSYALLFGFTMLAIDCWSLAVDPTVSPRHRALAAAAMTLALAAAITTNYFAVLAWIPIAAGEIARWHSERNAVIHWKSEWKIIAGLILAASPLLLFRPLMQTSVARFAPHASNRASFNLTALSDIMLLGNFLTAWLAILLLAWFFRTLQTRPRGKSHIPAHETVAVLCLALYPVLGYVASRIYGGMFSPRLVIPVCLGMAIAGTLAAYRLAGHRRSAAILLLLLYLATFAVRWTSKARACLAQRQAFYALLHQVKDAEAIDNQREPIVIADSLLVLTMHHYAPPAVASRIVLPLDLPMIQRTRGEDGAEENLWAGGTGLYELPILPMANFPKMSGSYLIVAEQGNWLLDDLRQHGNPAQQLPVAIPPDALSGYLTSLSHRRLGIYRTCGTPGCSPGN